MKSRFKSNLLLSWELALNCAGDKMKERPHEPTSAFAAVTGGQLWRGKARNPTKQTNNTDLPSQEVDDRCDVDELEEVEEYQLVGQLAPDLPHPLLPLIPPLHIFHHLHSNHGQTNQCLLHHCTRLHLLEKGQGTPIGKRTSQEEHLSIHA